MEPMTASTICRLIELKCLEWMSIYCSRVLNTSSLFALSFLGLLFSVQLLIFVDFYGFPIINSHAHSRTLLFILVYNGMFLDHLRKICT